MDRTVDVLGKPQIATRAHSAPRRPCGECVRRDGGGSCTVYGRPVDADNTKPCQTFASTWDEVDAQNAAQPKRCSRCSHWIEQGTADGKPVGFCGVSTMKTLGEHGRQCPDWKA
jgi:hypothetical protein